MATFVNNLRLKEITTGDEDGTWGDSTNTNLELITDAFGSGTIQLAADANETFTMDDGAADETRALVLEVTSAVSLTATRTVTLAPNTVNKVWIIKNSTTGSQAIEISQGSGANVTVANGETKYVYSDGNGATAAVTDALAGLVIGGAFGAEGAVTLESTLDVTGQTTLANLTATGTISFSGATVSNGGTVTTIDINGGTLDGVTIGGSSAGAGTFTNLTASGTVDFTGASVTDLGTVTTMDLNGGTVDNAVIGGSTPAAGSFTTLTASGDLTVDGGTLFVDASTNQVGIGNLTPNADDKVGIETSSGVESVTVSGIDNSANGYFRIDTPANRRNAYVWETAGTAAFTMERGDSDDADATSLYLHPGGPDGGASTDFVMNLSGQVGMGAASPSYQLHVIGPTVNGNVAAIGSVVGRELLISTFLVGGSNGVGINYNAQGDSGNAQHRWQNLGVTGMTLTPTGLTVAGALSKGSGSFKIDHPLKPETHHLVHSFVEGPQADNLYRGRAELNNGVAEIDLDDHFGLTPGTFVALNRNLQAFVQNDSGWALVKASAEGSRLVIRSLDSSSNDSVSWLVIGERHDPTILSADWTDDSGRPILEPEKDLDSETEI